MLTLLTLVLSLVSAVSVSADVTFPSQNPQRKMGDSLNGLTSLAVSKERDFLATSSERGVISIRDKRGRILASHEIDDLKHVYLGTPVFDPNDNQRVIFATANALFSWEWKRQASPRVLLGDEMFRDVDIRELAISPNGRMVAVIDGDQRVLLIEADKKFTKVRAIKTIQKSQNLSILEKNSIKSGAVTFSPDSTTVAQTTKSEITLYHVPSGKELRRLKAHTDVVGDLCFLDEKTLFSGSWDQSCRIWNTGDGTNRALPAMVRLKDCPLVARSHDGKQFVCVYDDQIVVYSFPEQKEVTRFRGPKSGLTGIEFLGDGRTLVTTGESPRLQFWDVTAGKELKK